jgi:hypothetical protein
VVEFAARYRFTPAALATMTFPVPLEMIVTVEPIPNPTVSFAGIVIV